MKFPTRKNWCTTVSSRVLRPRWRARAPQIAPFVEVIARAKVLAVRGDNQNACVVIAIKIVEHNIYLIPERPTQRVALVRTIQCQRRDPIFFFVDEMLEFHKVSSVLLVAGLSIHQHIC